MRQTGKASNFGLLYEMQAESFREYTEVNYGIVLTLDEATAIRTAYFEMWTGIEAWHQETIKRCEKTGQVTSPIGRVRRLPDIWHPNNKVSSYAARSAINSPVQGFASDMMQIAAASIAGLVPGHKPVEGVRLVGTVHDSILVEVPLDDWERATEECQRRMTEAVPRVLAEMGCAFKVPLVADAKVGTRWGLNDVAESADAAA